MKKRILVPLDGSKLGEAALDVVEKFLVADSKNESEIVLLGVVTAVTHWIAGGESGIDAVPASPIPYTEEELNSIKKSVLKYLDSVASRLIRHGVSVKTEVSTGHADREILKAVESMKIDIIAMSTHGRSGLSHLAFGSVTEKVLRQATVPVLTVCAREQSS